MQMYWAPPFNPQVELEGPFFAEEEKNGDFWNHHIKRSNNKKNEDSPLDEAAAASELQPVPDSLVDWDFGFLDPGLGLEAIAGDSQFTNPTFSPAPDLVFFQEPTMVVNPSRNIQIHQKTHLDHQQELVDQLIRAAELVEASELVGARLILARLNQQLPSPLGRSLLRSAFYFKDALHRLLTLDHHRPSSSSSVSAVVTPFDVAMKIGAHKAFSESSPVPQFANFTRTQALLEELGDADAIHVVDFDIGVGDQWSSFIQELAHRRPGSPPSVKITAFVCPSHRNRPLLELRLIHDNLTHFAADLGVPFKLRILTVDSFDPVELLKLSGNDEAVGVNLPIGSSHCHPILIPTLLRSVKRLGPRIVVSVDQGCDRSDLSFSQHFLCGLQSCTVLLDSIDAVGTGSDVASKIERFLLHPRIEGSVLGRHRAGDKKTPPWRTVFAQAGFAPLHFSNFTETQAECLLKRVQVRGFHVEKRQASLSLHWQHRELLSVSAWRC